METKQTETVTAGRCKEVADFSTGRSQCKKLAGHSGPCRHLPPSSIHQSKAVRR